MTTTHFIMGNITDNELDLLLAQSAKQQRAVKNINANVMRMVRRDLRRKRLRKWAKLLGISFGLPSIIVVYVYLLYAYMPQLPEQLRIASFVLPIATIAILLAKKMRSFSVSDM